MAATIYNEDLLWLVDGGTAPVQSFDASKPAVTLPRRVPTARGCSFQIFDPSKAPGGANDSVQGTLTVATSNAPVRNMLLVGDAFWVILPDLTLTIGGDQKLPSMQPILFPCFGWLRVAWAPNGASGQLAGRFDGPRP